MKRRTWIQTALAAPAALALPAAAQPQAKDEFAKVETASGPAGEPMHRFFSRGEFAALQRLSSAILPSIDGKPGAVEAGVPEFLDFLISVSPVARQRLYREGLAKLEAGATLDALHEPWTYQPPADAYKRFLREAKDDILQASFASREWIESHPERRGGAGTYYLAVD